MNHATEQRLQPASLTTAAAVSMALVGTGHVERKSQAGIGKMLQASGQGEEGRGGRVQKGSLFPDILSPPALCGESALPSRRGGRSLAWLLGIIGKILLQVKHRNICCGDAEAPRSSRKAICCLCSKQVGARARPGKGGLCNQHQERGTQGGGDSAGARKLRGTRALLQS